MHGICRTRMYPRMLLWCCVLIFNIFKNTFSYAFAGTHSPETSTVTSGTPSVAVAAQRESGRGEHSVASPSVEPCAGPCPVLGGALPAVGPPVC